MLQLQFKYCDSKLFNVYNLNCTIYMGYDLFGVLRHMLYQMCSCTNTADFNKSCMDGLEVKIKVLLATGGKGKCKIRTLTFEKVLN